MGADFASEGGCVMSVVSDTIDWFGDSANWSGDDGVPHRLVQHLGYTSLTVAVAAGVRTLVEAHPAYPR